MGLRKSCGKYKETSNKDLLAKNKEYWEKAKSGKLVQDDMEDWGDVQNELKDRLKIVEVKIKIKPGFGWVALEGVAAEWKYRNNQGLACSFDQSKMWIVGLAYATGHLNDNDFKPPQK